MHPERLDDLDQAILRALARDARATFAQVGAEVSLSAPAVKRRVDRLRERGVIRGFTVRLDPAALGWHTEAFVEIFCQGSTSPTTMRAAVERYAEVVSASTVTGDVDLVVQVRARDMRHLEEVVERLAAESFVARTRSTVVLSALVRRPDALPSPDPSPTP
ncbi:Lrp/AsnC family transcriptional regulator [Cellulomonas sp. S1-8]|uniref:Lrp/AsnC family transcriptional regulator n=1 Tax=Cellulomonas sp. S1-8 TaxID=2904790 RepID=UPI00224419A2|nr:Lrp/AsnC family transcriptional regulator [Cellulomonas sp. S1-8]UZN04174.1 Lrp/AsnC family transcriptional regulator [Cellulomonas sp. S1-8]